MKGDASLTYILLPGPPATKKNSQQLFRSKSTGRVFPVPSKAYKAYEASALPLCPRLHIATPVNVRCVYYMPTHRSVDLSNLISATDDILVRAGTIADDNRDIVAAHDGSRVLYDKEHPRTEITVTPLEDYEQWKKP